MDETGKKTTWKAIIAVALVVLEDGAVAEAVFGGELIYDKNGNLLYGEKELWG